MTQPTEAQADIVERKFLLVKRGLYYAPERQGYTGIKDRAGRYLEADAYPPEVVAIHEDDAPLFSPACWPETKAAYYEAEIPRLRAQLAEAELRGVKAGLEAALKALKTAQYDPAPYTKGSSAIRAIDPASVAIDPETGHA